MSSSFRHLALGCVVLVMGFHPGISWADGDGVGLGDGHAGALNHTVVGPINDYLPLPAPASSGASLVDMQRSLPSPWASGDLVMIWAVSGADREPSTTPQAITLTASDSAGNWEFARVLKVNYGCTDSSSKNGTCLLLSNGLIHSYPANQSQIIRVPEYTDVTVASKASITAKPWDGSTGGIAAFLANGVVTLNGTISADGAGLRGGAAATDKIPRMPGDCAETSGDPVNSFAQKGESIAATHFGTCSDCGGFGAITNGGGGGNCSGSGGGGGGNGGIGGNGGATSGWDDYRSVGGAGGAAVDYTSVGPTRLILGGGGGAGQGGFATASDGARGGGVVFFRAQSLAGTGRITAAGAAAPGSQYWDDGIDGVTGGAGGGGAGGTVVVQLTSSSAGCAGAALTAPGGRGGTTPANPRATTWNGGAGGGGGGGRIFLQAAGGSCSLAASAGLGGVCQDSRSAQNGQGGLSGIPGSVEHSVQPLEGFCCPACASPIGCPDGQQCDLLGVATGVCHPIPLDAGMTDAEQPLDVGTADANPGADAATSAAEDAGHPNATEPPVDHYSLIGCGCLAAPAASSLPLGLLGVAGMLSARRRRQVR